MAMSKLKQKQYEVEALVELIEFLERKDNDLHQKWVIVEPNCRQAKDWRTNEPVWEDEEQTIPKMEDRYDWVPKDDDDLSEEDIYRSTVYQALIKKLEALA